MFEALGNSIVLALCASLGAAVIGTLGAYGFTKVQLRTKVPWNMCPCFPS